MNKFLIHIGGTVTKVLIAPFCINMFCLKYLNGVQITRTYKNTTTNIYDHLVFSHRYIIVIDDIWDKSAWKNIRCALIENECGSRVIATTRILDVAKEVGGVYQLKPLSTIVSRKLFYQRIFGDEDKRPHIQLAEVSENILRKCGGVPLAIITMASLLAIDQRVKPEDE